MSASKFDFGNLLGPYSPERQEEPPKERRQGEASAECGGFKLRPYQEKARHMVLEEWRKGNKKTLLVLPTGCGKTIVFAAIIDSVVKNGGRVLVLAHRGELLEQAADKLRKAYGIDSNLEKAESSGVFGMFPVTVGSIQTLAQPKRLEAVPPDYFTAIVVDEAHHCLSESYQKVLAHFPNASLLGVTATPDRGDRKELGRFFDSLAFEYGMRDAIKEGFLCPIKARMIPLKIGIATPKNGDYAAEDIGSALEPYLEQIAREMAGICKGKKTVAFLPLIRTSQKLCAMLNGSGLRAKEVNGESTDRKETLESFEKGGFDVLCNSMLLTEGWDCPSVDCVVVLRPTKVRSLYQQMVGRGMRLSPGKESLLLLDFLWMTERHDLCKPSSLMSKDKGVAERVNTSLEKCDAEYDLIEEQESAEKDAQLEREAALAKELEKMKRRKGALVDPLEYALSISDEALSYYDPVFPWEKERPTEKQIAYLEKRGISTGAISCKGHAAMIIGRLHSRDEARLSTPKQIRLLERYGYRNVGTWKNEQAKKEIDRIASNGWRQPRGLNPESFVPESIGG